MDDQTLTKLLHDLESDRVERKSTASRSSREKIRQTICAFANDLPNHQAPGVLFIGVDDKGGCKNIDVDDDLLLSLSHYRDNGDIVPFPTMHVQKRTLGGCDLAVVIVKPSQSPPVRYRGRAWVRVGPRLGIATAQEERLLSEKRRSGDVPFDLTVIQAATDDDLDIDLFQRTYLRSAVAFDVLEENNRSLEQQLRSLRFISRDNHLTPTVVGLLTVGKDPRQFIYGAYVQFLRIDGPDLLDDIIDQKELSGPLPDLMRLLDDLLEINVNTSSSFISTAVESKRPDYPIEALRQLIRNAVLHRTYESTNAPIRINWFNDRIEIHNPGGLYGQVTEQNIRFGTTDYRNPHIAEALKNLGYVQRFGFGIRIAEKKLAENGNPPLEIQTTPNDFLAVVRKRK